LGQLKCYRKGHIRLTKAEPVRELRRRQRGRSYDHEEDGTIRVIAKALDNICAERMTPSLFPLARLLIEHRELAVSDRVLDRKLCP
jgi:hypothetical protein